MKIEVVEPKILCERIKKEGDYQEKMRGLLVLYANLSAHGNKMGKKDRALLYEFFINESRSAVEAFENAETYKAKDGVALYGDRLMGLPMLLMRGKNSIPADGVDEVFRFGNWLKVINAYDELAAQCLDKESVGEEDVKELIDCVLKADEEYYKNKFYHALLRRKNMLSNFTPEARAAVVAFLAEEAERYLKEVAPDEDTCVNFKLLSDTCGCFYDIRAIGLLKAIVLRKEDDIAFVAFQSLLRNGCYEREAVDRFAHNPVYASLTYRLLERAGKDEYFPEECLGTEYLAQSDLVYWLSMPMELGKEPDEVEYFGKIFAHQRDYYIFRFRSASENLAEGDKNVWLLGWSERSMGAFSNYQKFSAYDKGKQEKTLQFIKKKILQ